jgi:hypothetical protein
MESKAGPPNINVFDDGLVDKACSGVTNFKNDLILNLNIVAWWMVNKTRNKL